MLQNDFIRQILHWVDDNLDKDITVHDIVQRSGYSPAQLNRLFKKEMGCTLNDYVLSKRMYKCALALKFSTVPISALSKQYHYANPQAFTRAFKAAFNLSPSDYRDNPNFDFEQLFAWKHQGEVALSGCRIEFEHIHKRDLYGIKGSYQLLTQDVSKNHTHGRMKVESEFQFATQRPVEKIYTLCKPLRKEASTIYIEFHIGMQDAQEHDMSRLEPLPSVAGDYLKFIFSDNTLKPFDCASIAYKGFITPNQIKRRDGYDIELFDYSSFQTKFGCTYTVYVPVIFDAKLIDALLKVREPE